MANRLKALLDDATLLDAEKLGKAKKEVKITMEERYKNLAEGKSEKQKLGAQFFFRRLRF